MIVFFNAEIFMNDIKWKPYYHEPGIAIDKNMVHLFKVCIDRHYHQIKHIYQEVLSAKELNKSIRFINSKDRERYIVSKYLLRCILSKFILTVPALIQFKQLANKKPIVDGIEFSVTHSGNYLLLAIGPEAVGIDIEFINKNFDFESLLTACFNADECSFINMGENRLLNFYKLWTRKEALLKASGEGLTDSLNQFSCLGNFVTRKQVQYHLNSFTIDDDYIISLAISSTYKGQPNYWNYL